MSRFGVSEEKERKLFRWMEELEIYEVELDEKFIKGSGPGGQKINKTAICVQLTHSASGTEIKCQKTRSQALNRYYARVELCEKLDEKLKGEKSKKRQAIEKIRRQKRKRSKRAKEKILENKKKRSTVKKLRKTPKIEE